MANHKSLAVFGVILATICIFPLTSLGKTEERSAPAATLALFNHNSYLPVVARNEAPPIAPSPSPTSRPIPSSTPSSTSVPPSGTSIVADHTVISQFDSLTSAQISAASSQRVLFLHQSVGGQISSGLNCLEGVDPDPLCYPYPDNVYVRDNWVWPLFERSDAPGKLAEFEDTINAQVNNYDVFGMKFCFLDWWFQSFDDYRDMMLRFASAHPNKKLIWATQALWDDMSKSPDPGAIKSFNDSLRNYAQTHDIALYDVAAIESHQANGTLCTQTLGGVTYEVLCPAWRVAPDDPHPSTEGGIRLAKGFWWLMARISGSE